MKCFGFALLRSVIGLKNSRHQLSQSDAKPKQSRLGRTHFPALGAGHVNLLRALIGPFCCLRLLKLAIVIALVLVLVLRHSTERRTLTPFIYLIIYIFIYSFILMQFFLSPDGGRLFTPLTMADCAK